jgi:hypothetical protein
MATSMRTIQATMNGAGFSTNEMQALFDINPTILQNYLTGATANVNASTALVDTFVSGNTSAGIDPGQLPAGRVRRGHRA